MVRQIQILLVCTIFIMLSGCNRTHKTIQNDKSKCNIVIASGLKCGIYYPTCSMLGDIFRNGGCEVEVLGTKGGAENIELLKSGKANMAIVMSDILTEENFMLDNISLIMPLYPNYVQLVVRADADINSINDLKGKRVSVGKVNSGIEINTKALLATYGLSFDDIGKFNLSFSEAAEYLRNNKIDAAFLTSGVPNDYITGLLKSSSIKILSINEEAREALFKKNPLITTGIIPAGTYGNKHDITTVKVINLLVVSNHIPEEVIYNLLKTLYKSIGNMGSKVGEQFISFHEIQKTEYLHKGATKFFKEIR